MQTSNKILLGTLLATLLIITALHLALYAKIKSGDFASAKQITFEGESHALPAAKYVSITGLVNCRLTSSTEPRIETSGAPDSRLSYKVVNDTLYVSGDSTLTKDDYSRGMRNHQSVTLSLPGVQQVTLSYGTLRLAGSPDSLAAPSYSIVLGTDAHLGIWARGPEEPKVFFKQLNLSLSKSSMDLENNTVIDHMQVRTVASHLQYRNAQINHLAMDVDNSSTIAIQGKQIKNLTVISKP